MEPLYQNALRSRSQQNSTISTLPHPSILASAAPISFITSTVNLYPLFPGSFYCKYCSFFSGIYKSLISSMYNYTGFIISWSVIVSPHQLFKILDPDLQYCQKDHFWEKKNSESNLMFLECTVAVMLWLYCNGTDKMCKCLSQVRKGGGAAGGVLKL